MSFSASRTSWQAETYAEMGAAVPFTTPELTGARARRGKDGLELTLPNPSGKRGIYILDPKDMVRYCAPGLHDRHLAAGLGALPDVTPASIRALARDIAMAGLAGRHAAAAGRLAREAERRAALSAQLHILRRLVARLDGAQADLAAIDRSAKAAIAALAARSGQPNAAILHAISHAAALEAATGAAPNETCRHAALASDLSTMLVDLAGCGATGRAGRAQDLIVSAGADAVALARLALADAWRRLADLPALLTAGASGIEALSIRLDWLLDGWAPICRLWRAAPPGRVAATINEIGLMVPSIPAETGGWYGVTVNEAARQNLRAEVVGFTEWRHAGLWSDLLARNEVFRAQAA
jgi:hypothetical protein